MQYLCNQLRGVCGTALTPTHISSLYCVQSFQALTFASSECLFLFMEIVIKKIKKQVSKVLSFSSK